MGELKKWLDQKWVRINTEAKLSASAARRRISVIQIVVCQRQKLAPSRRQSVRQQHEKETRRVKKARRLLKNTRKATVTNMSEGGEVRRR